jgi:hypothetical protein
LIFRVWEVPSSAVVSYDNPNLTGGAVTTNRLGAGTGSFVAGEVCEDGHVDNLALTQNNYTEILYSLKIVAADFVHGDTLRFRILRNGVTTGVTYSQTPTINIIRRAANVAATISSSWGTWTGAADGSVTTPTANIVASISTNWSGEVLHAWFGADPADTFSQPPYELGTKFTVSTPTSCVGIRIRNPGTTWAGAADGRYARLWDGVTQAQLKTLNIVETMPSGWSEYLWDAPVALEAAHEYIVSHNVSTEGMCATTHLLDTSVTSGPVTLIMGQFDNNPGVFPATVYQNSFYGVDVLYGGTGRGWTATAAGTVSGPAITDHPGTIASAWGTWTATAAGTVVAEVITGTITTTWGTWTATAAGTVVAEVITGTVTTAWGTWTATSIAIRLAYAGISTLWGTWTGSAAGSVGTPAGWSIPPNVLATTTGPSTITVTWDDVPAATGYDVERNGTVIVYNHPDSPYNDSGLNSDTLYSYRVRAVG